MKNLKSLFPLAALVLVGCTKEVESVQTIQDIAVVEAYLEPNEPIQVKLSKLLPYTEEEYAESLIIDTAQVYITHNGTTVQLQPSLTQPGVYLDTVTQLAGEAGHSYSLQFMYNNQEVSATTTIPNEPLNGSLSTNVLEIDTDVVGPGVSLTPVTVSWSNASNEYHMVMVEYMESNYAPINEGLPEEDYYKFAKITTEPVVGNSYDLNTRRHLAFFGTYRIKIYRLNEEYVNLYENISQSSLNLTAPATNVVNGLGIFTGMSYTTVYLEVEEM